MYERVDKCHTHRHLLLTLILTVFRKLRSFVCQTQSVNKRYLNMSCSGIKTFAAAKVQLFSDIRKYICIFFLEFPEYPDRYAHPETDNIRTNRQSQKQHRR